MRHAMKKPIRNSGTHFTALCAMRSGNRARCFDAIAAYLAHLPVRLEKMAIPAKSMYQPSPAGI
jgi:hypothetical protein